MTTEVLVTGRPDTGTCEPQKTSWEKTMSRTPTAERPLQAVTSIPEDNAE